VGSFAGPVRFFDCLRAAGYHFHPFDLSKWVDAGIGFAFSISVFLFEIRLQRASMRR